MCTELELVLCLDGEAKAAKAHTLFLPVVQASWGTEGKIWDKLKKFLSFFFSTVYFTARCHTHTHTKLSAETHIFTEEQAQKHIHRVPSLRLYVWVGGRKVGEIIFLLREIDVICSALHCLRTIWANSLFSADLVVGCACDFVCVCGCVCQQRTKGI